MLLVLLSAAVQESQRNCGFWLGYYSLRNPTLASVSALLAEALVLKLRKQSVAATLKSNSALLTGLLLAVSVPSRHGGWSCWVRCLRVIIAKQLYGGVGAKPV
ncbi:RnfABCDGE type electron transport complex subunit D [Escherichia coli]|uniref:RnfABCDGE type electron transport complex subunit D n=1 Tax=Escherichia coli TaxID=562 RepID=UPI003D653A13